MDYGSNMIGVLKLQYMHITREQDIFILGTEWFVNTKLRTIPELNRTCDSWVQSVYHLQSHCTLCTIKGKVPWDRHLFSYNQFEIIVIANIYIYILYMIYIYSYNL